MHTRLSSSRLESSLLVTVILIMRQKFIFFDATLGSDLPSAAARIVSKIGWDILTRKKLNLTNSRNIEIFLMLRGRLRGRNNLALATKTTKKPDVDRNVMH